MKYIFIPSDSDVLEGYKKSNVSIIPTILEENVLSYRKVDNTGMLLRVYKDSYFLIDFYDPHKFIDYLNNDIADSILLLEVVYNNNRIKLPFITRHIDDKVFDANKSRCSGMLESISKKFVLLPKEIDNNTNDFDNVVMNQIEIEKYSQCPNKDIVDIYNNKIIKPGYISVPVLYNKSNNKIYF